MTTFVTSDTHFWHKRIIPYCARPFTSVERMNEELIRRWNQKVKYKDTVYHVGDFSFGGEDLVSEIVSQLKGTIVLILGNHDRKSTIWWNKVGIKEVHKGRLTVCNYILSHYPIPSEEMLFSNGCINLHGHLHSQKIKSDKKHICVGVDYTDFFPVPFESLPKYHQLQMS